MGTQNKLSNLNNLLFEQLERINDDDLPPEEFDKEMSRAKAMTGLAAQIVASGTLQLKALTFADEKINADSKVPLQLTE